MRAPSLALPKLRHAFHPYAREGGETSLGVHTQKLGPLTQVEAYFSKQTVEGGDRLQRPLPLLPPDPNSYLPYTRQKKEKRLCDGPVLKAQNTWNGWLTIMGSCSSSYCTSSHFEWALQAVLQAVLCQVT